MKTWPESDLPMYTDEERWCFLEEKIRKEDFIKLSLDDATPDDFPQGFRIGNYAGDSLPMAIDFAIGLSDGK
jgi:hypothetical protein